MNITVFGGSGFLGSHICDKLTQAGHAVTIVDLLPSPWLKSGQTMLVGSILDEELVNHAVKGADFVFN
ncbi:MAG: NAD(P)-dependent oxidoreductase, partial [Desulfovibrio sp.]|nr:NAD(P)-dependent oxidoreductase [Desulfovibrio sp.]